VFATIAIAVGVIALIQRTDAQQARTEADTAARQAEQAAAAAEQQLLTARARELADDELDLALLLAVEARRRSGDADALDALATVQRAEPAIEKFSYLGTAASAGLDVGADGRRGAMLDGERLVRFTLPDLSMEPPRTIAGATGLAMSPTSSQIAVTTPDGVTVVDAATGAIDARLSSLSPSGLEPDDVIWIGPSRLGVQHKQGLRYYMRVVDLDTGFDSEAEPTPVSANAAMASDESGHRLAIGPLPPGLLDFAPKWIRIVDTATGEVTRLLESPLGRVTDLSFQPGGDLLAVGTADAGLYVLDTVTGATVLRRVMPVGEAGRFSPDGTKLAIRDGAGTVTVIDATTGTVLLPPVLQDREPRNVYFTPDADALVADAESALITIRLDGREPLASAPFGKPGDTAGAVSSDGEVAWAIRPDWQSVAYHPDDGSSTLTISDRASWYGTGDDWLYTLQDDGHDAVIDSRSGATLFTGSVVGGGRYWMRDLRASMVVRGTRDGQYVDVRRLPDLSPIEHRLGSFQGTLSLAHSVTTVAESPSPPSSRAARWSTFSTSPPVTS
jgi:DNA-binding beta-propeller fold protein YncE